MSAVAMMLHDDAVYMFSDTASYGRDGRLLREISKTAVLLPQRCVLTVRGPLRAAGLMRMHCGHRASFDDLLAGLLDDMLDAATFAFLHEGEPVEMAATVAGWSERRNEWVLGEIGAHGDSPDDLRLGSAQFREFSPVWFDPPVDGARLAASGLIDENANLATTDMVDAGLRILQLQRAHNYPTAFPAEHRVGTVGGSVMMVRLAQKGTVAVSGILHKWPDEIGQPLGREIADRVDYFYESELAGVPPAATGDHPQ